MDESRAVPPVVSKRNHFSSLDEYVDMAMREIGRHGIFGKDTREQDRLRSAIRDAFRHFMANLNHAFSKACTSAIDQAEHLIEDPDFYQTRKARLKNELARQAEQRSVETKKCKDRELFGPSPEELEYKRKRTLEMIAYHEQQIARYKTDLANMPNLIGPQIKGAHITQ